MQKALQRIDQLEKERASASVRVDQVEKSMNADAERAVVIKSRHRHGHRCHRRAPQ